MKVFCFFLISSLAFISVFASAAAARGRAFNSGDTDVDKITKLSKRKCYQYSCPSEDFAKCKQDAKAKGDAILTRCKRPVLVPEEGHYEVCKVHSDSNDYAQDCSEVWRSWQSYCSKDVCFCEEDGCNKDYDTCVKSLGDKADGCKGLAGVYTAGEKARLHIGRFELVSWPACPKFHNYLTALGVKEELRKIIEKTKMTVGIKQDGDEYTMTYRGDAGRINHREIFKLGQEYKADFFGSKDVSLHTDWEGDKLVQTLNFEGKNTRFELTFDEHSMRWKFILGDITDVRVFKRL